MMEQSNEDEAQMLPQTGAPFGLQLADDDPDLEDDVIDEDEDEDDDEDEDEDDDDDDSDDAYVELPAPGIEPTEPWPMP